MFGALIVCIFIDSIKLITGYQRPYFLRACNVTPTACDTLPYGYSTYPSPELLCQRQRSLTGEPNRDISLDLRYAW